MTTNNIKIAFARPQEDEAFEFFAVQRGRMFYNLLFQKATLERAQQAEPIYVMACETAEQWTSAGKWLAERRDHWQRWAAMAKISPELLARRLDGLFAIEPMDRVIDG